MSILKRLQDSLKSGKNDPFPSPFNRSNSNLGELINEGGEVEARENDGGGHKTLSKIKKMLKKKRRTQYITPAMQLKKSQMKATPEKDEYPFCSIVKTCKW